ncbi:MAG: hypothetical protein IJI25_08805 [Eubacterium sp.]|nr:hypothetical protein [Eubacterium sp.]
MGRYIRVDKLYKIADKYGLKRDIRAKQEIQEAAIEMDPELIDKMYLAKCEEVNKLRELISGKFDPDKYVEVYNSLIEKESKAAAEPFLEHEYI